MPRKRGRPRDEARKVRIVADALLMGTPAEVAILRGTSKAKFNRWTVRPLTKDLYVRVGATHGVSSEYVRKLYTNPGWRKEALRYIAETISARIERRQQLRKRLGQK